MRDDLVGIHVAAGARAGLEHVDRELPVVLALDDFQRSFLDRGGALGVDAVELRGVRGRGAPT